MGGAAALVPRPAGGRRLSEGPRLRRAARVLVLDTAGRTLLVRFVFPARVVWAPPGGGLEPGETHEQAALRELAEEVGLDGVPLGPEVWRRTHVVEWVKDVWDGQAERVFLVRTEPFEPAPRLSPEELRDEHVHELRWWTPEELERGDAVFAPLDLPALVRRILDEGPPAEPWAAGA